MESEAECRSVPTLKEAVVLDTETDHPTCVSSLYVLLPVVLWGTRDLEVLHGIPKELGESGVLKTAGEVLPFLNNGVLHRLRHYLLPGYKATLHGVRGRAETTRLLLFYGCLSLGGFTQGRRQRGLRRLGRKVVNARAE